MPTAPLMPLVRYRAIDSNGNPMNGAKLYFYIAGTTTPKDTYSDSARSIANANPVVADAGGLFGAIYLSAAAYKVALKTSADVELWNQDNVVADDFLLADALTVSGAWTFSALLTANAAIKFPAVQAASSNANALDDYEEGTFTPLFGGSTSETGQAYTTQLGRYIKVGKQVWVSGRITLSTLGTITGNVMIKGLPFTSSAAAFQMGLCVIFWNAFTTAYVYLSATITASVTAAELRGATAAATELSVLAQANLAATSDIVFTGTYEADG